MWQLFLLMALAAVILAVPVLYPMKPPREGALQSQPDDPAKEGTPPDRSDSTGGPK
jgi:hypothetical protein